MHEFQVLPIPGTDPPLAAAIRIFPIEMQASVEEELESNGDALWTPMDTAAALARWLNAWDAARWAVGDADRLQWVMDHTGPRAWSAMQFICNHDRCSGDDIADAAGYVHGAQGFKSTLSHLAKRCRQVDRRPMWEVTRDDPTCRWSYYLTDEVKELMDALG